MTTLFVQNAKRQWNSSDATERAYFACAIRGRFTGMKFSVGEVVAKRFDELDNLIALRLAEFFWASRGQH